MALLNLQKHATNVGVVNQALRRGQWTTVTLSVAKVASNCKGPSNVMYHISISPHQIYFKNHDASQMEKPYS